MAQTSTRGMASVQEFATRARLASGIVLMAFVVMHLANHALGIHSVRTMEEVQRAFGAVWRSWPGTVLLYGALATHLAVSLHGVWRLRTFRLPAWQVAQLVAGLAIPLLLLGHVFGTRIAHEVGGLQDTYEVVLRALWPEAALRQSILLVLVWGHGALGLHFWLRLKPWYRRLAPLPLLIAILVPVLALMGFALAGREVMIMDQTGYAALAEGERPGQRIPPAAAAWLSETQTLARNVLIALIVVALGRPLVRAIRGHGETALSIRYPSGTIVPITPGMSVLEASRSAGIPHASVCGGRGRCSTCRVRLADHDLAGLPPPGPDEARVLARIHAGPNVRLACQLRPHKAIAVIPLLSAGAGPEDTRAPVDPAQGVEREVAVLFADLRAFTRMTEGRLPYDVVFVLNQYFQAAGRAIEDHGGRVDKFIGDGVMALFGTASDPDSACAAALRSARALALAMDDLNRRLAPELHEPLRIAIGLHVGAVILGDMGYGRATSLTAIGDAVNVASRLETLAKTFDVDLVVSAEVALRAGVDLTTSDLREIEVRGRRQLLQVRLVRPARDLPVRLPARPAGGGLVGRLARLHRQLFAPAQEARPPA